MRLRCNKGYTCTAEALVRSFLASRKVLLRCGVLRALWGVLAIGIVISVRGIIRERVLVFYSVLVRHVLPGHVEISVELLRPEVSETRMPEEVPLGVQRVNQSWRAFQRKLRLILAECF